MKIQPTSLSEKKRHGEHVVRIVADKTIAPINDVLEKIEAVVPEGVPVKTATDGYGRVAYAFCETAKKERETELRIAGEDGIQELINNLRFWIALHSHIYYNLGKNVVSDEAWDRKAEKLAHLQNVHSPYAGSWKTEAFEEFEGDTGYHLPVTNEIEDRAQELLSAKEE